MLDLDAPVPTLAARWRRLLGLLHLFVIAALLGAVGCGEDEADAGAEEPRDVPTYDEGVIRFSPAFAEQMGLKIEAAAVKEIQPLVYVTGTLELNELRIAAVGSRIQARVRQVHVVEGTQVEIGDPLASLESADLGEAQAEILAIRARAKVADTDEERKRALMNQGIASKRAAELASQESSIADAELMAARQRVKALGGSIDGKNLGLLTLTSPIAGEVINVHVFRGQAVEPSHTAFTIGDYNQLWVRLAVFERELQNIRVDDKVEIRPVATPDQVITGEVAYISRMLDPQTRSAEVRVVVPNEEGKLRVGQGVTAGIQAGGARRATLAVSREAIIQVDGKPTVFVAVEDNAVVPRPVETGVRDPTQVEIKSGLKEGERVVSAGVFALKSEIFR
ncbi:MAG: efflux RND transporter periplasmic adaptor subunit [Nannocystaceae bacterium]